MMRSVSVITPIFNEAAILEDTILRIDSFLSQNLVDYEIIVIESGSTDNSGELCDNLTARLPSLHIIHEGTRNGFGSALRVGYQHATKDLIWLITVDLPFALDTLLVALPLLDQYDCVLSYRSQDPRSPMRQFQSTIYNILVKTCLGLDVRQVNSAFKIFKRSVIQTLPLHSKGWFLDVEILYRLKQRHVAWIEIPVDLIERTSGRSSVKPFTFIAVLKELVGFIFEEAR